MDSLRSERYFLCFFCAVYRGCVVFSYGFNGVFAVSLLFFDQFLKCFFDFLTCSLTRIGVIEFCGWSS